MTLPQLPTDNLYKFMFLAGITIMGASSFLYVEKYSEINGKLDNIELDILNSELTFYKDTVNISFDLRMNTESQKNDSVCVAEIVKLVAKKNEIPDSNFTVIRNNLEKTEHNLIQMQRTLLDKQISNHVQSANILHKLKKLGEDKAYLLGISLFCGVCFIIGGALTKYGYKMWKLKVQNPNDEKLILELKKIKAENI